MSERLEMAIGLVITGMIVFALELAACWTITGSLPWS